MAVHMRPGRADTGPAISGQFWMQVWEIVQTGLRQRDMPCQLRPGYYVVALPATRPRDAMIAADRIRSHVTALSESHELSLVTHIGVSSWSPGQPSAGIGQLLWEARHAMEMAASSGSECPFVYI